MRSQRTDARRRVAIALAIALAGLATSCGWSDEQRRNFLNDCLTNARLDDDQLRNDICNCWLERISALYSLDELNSGSAEVQRENERIGQECARDHGVEAYFPPNG
jgi:hypothetical protein